MDIGGLQRIFVSNMDMSAAITLYINAFAILESKQKRSIRYINRKIPVSSQFCFQFYRCHGHVERLDVQNRHSHLASNDMCTFAVVNMAFAPVFPVVTIQLREELGSSNPFSIALPAVLTAGCTILISILACKILERRY